VVKQQSKAIGEAQEEVTQRWEEDDGGKQELIPETMRGTSKGTIS